MVELIASSLFILLPVRGGAQRHCCYSVRIPASWGSCRMRWPLPTCRTTPVRLVASPSAERGNFPRLVLMALGQHVLSRFLVGEG